jgi:hypothetical protein
MPLKMSAIVLTLVTAAEISGMVICSVWHKQELEGKKPSPFEGGVIFKLM